MKKALILSLISLALLTFAYFWISKSEHSQTKDLRKQTTWNRINGMEIRDGNLRAFFYKEGETWYYRALENLGACVQRDVDSKHFGFIEAILKSGLQSDLNEKQASVWHTLGIKEDSRRVYLFENNVLKDEIILGISQRLDSSSEERTWIRFAADEKSAIRVFIPLIDFGTLLSKPIAQWRKREIFSLNPKTIDEISIKTPVDSLGLVSTVDEATGEQHWQLKDDSLFALDTEKLEGLILNLAQLNADNFADCVEEKDILQDVEGATLDFKENGASHKIVFGRLVEDLKICSHCRDIEKGDRFVSVDGRVWIFSENRILSLLVRKNTLRSRNIYPWSLELIEAVTQINDTQDRVLKKTSEQWRYEVEGEEIAMDEERLLRFLRQIERIKAIRFLEETELREVEVFEVLQIHRKNQTDHLYLSRELEGYHIGRLNEGARFIIERRIAKNLTADLRK